MTDDTRTDGDVGHHGDAMVNGPEDDSADWLSIDWAAVEADVRRLLRWMGGVESNSRPEPSDQEE